MYKSQDPRSYGEAHFIISWGRKLTHEVQTSNSDGIQRAPSSNHDSCGHLVDDTDTDNMDRERGGGCYINLKSWLAIFSDADTQFLGD